MTTIRKRIAERLVFSQQSTATLTTFNEIDMSAVMALRAQYKDRFKEKYDVNLGFMGLFVKASIEALRAFPAVNAFIEGQDIVFNDFFNIGIAVGTEKGLLVPVIKNAENLSVAKIELAIREFAKKARDGKISVDDLNGGTFTITNGGVYGSLLSTPILNPPQSGILGLHKIEERAVVVAGKVEVRPMMYVALSYDHRIIDGKEAVSFLVKVKEGMEDPARLLLEV
jgi:2-oxoglutarate dehydrogenase E2 component (dihydrolipoamide succinyltransferase)